MYRPGESKRQLLLKCGAVFFALVLLMSALLLAISWWERAERGSGESDPQAEDALVYRGRRYALKEGITTLLVMGLDTFDNEGSDAYRNNKQADFLTLLVMDNHEKTCKAIHLNRDTMAEIEMLDATGEKVVGTTMAQLALAHTYGDGREESCLNTVRAVENLLGIDILYYVSVSMDAVPQYNDLLGGVPVEIMDDFTSIDPTMVQGETVTLTGDQALTYVRSRKGLDDPSNQQRMKRQKQYIQALLKATAQQVEADESFMLSAVQKLNPYWISNRDDVELARMASQYRVNDPVAFYTLEGTSEMGEQYLEFYPDEESILEVVIDCFYKLAK